MLTYITQRKRGSAVIDFVHDVWLDGGMWSDGDAFGIEGLRER